MTRRGSGRSRAQALRLPQSRIPNAQPVVKRAVIDVGASISIVDRERVLPAQLEVDGLAVGPDRGLEAGLFERLDGDLIAALADALDHLDAANLALGGDLDLEDDVALDPELGAGRALDLGHLDDLGQVLDEQLAARLPLGLGPVLVALGVAAT